MAKKEEFKEFVKKNPKLANFVRTGDMSWQKFYEMYDLYGQENEVWKDYLTPKQTEKEVAAVAGATAGAIGLPEILNFVKNVDLDSIQNGVSSIQRVLGVLQDFGTKDTPKKDSYKPRPIYKHFED